MLGFRNVKIIFFCFTFCVYGAADCPENIVTGKGSSALNDLFNYLSQDFGYNRSLIHRNTKLFYKDDSLINSKMAISSKTNSPTGFATMLVPMSDEEQNETEYKQTKIFPMMATSVVMVYNLPNIPNLVISMTVVSLIYQGFITLWNDPRIAVLNPGIVLPKADIKVVARRDDTGATYTLTTALSGIDDSWKNLYGNFSNPDFVGNQCCNSTKWPRDVISYFAAGGTGLIGILTSIPFTLGYANLAVAAQSNIQYAALVNNANQKLLPTPETVRAAITYYSWFHENSLVYDLNNANIPNAYPMVTYIYFVVDMKSNPNLSCCNVQETVAFFDWYMSCVNSTVLYSYSFVPLPDLMISQIRQTIIQEITCQGIRIYDDYITSVKPVTQILTLWNIILIVASVVVLTFVVGLTIYTMKLRKKRRAEETKWFLPLGKIKPHLMFEAFHSSLTGTTTSNSQHSSNGSSKSDNENYHNNATMRLKHVLEIGELDGEAVYLQPLKDFPYPLGWKRSTKKCMSKLTQDMTHKNVNRIIGVALYQDYLHLVIDYSFKGTLHFVLQTCHYELNDVVKSNLAIDIATGMQFLTTKGVINGCLSSVTCYVDGSWTVKLGEWGQQSLLATENIIVSNNFYQSETPTDDADFIRLLYKDYETVNVKNIFKHDVLSFGLLLVEIFTRKLPYFDQVEAGNIAYSQILDEKLIKHQQTELHIETLNIPLKIVEVLNLCCLPINQRPTFSELVVTLTKSKTSRKGIIDAMMDIVETYAIDLHQKTADMQLLNTRMEELLHDVLPPQIANKLFQGEIVEPEHFESVTICFADVVGFTNISSKSKPREVMNFLNDLWIMFDNILHKFDTYKIDTIGDAYLVCSGLPQRNGYAHCKQIASLSLELLQECETFKIFHLPNEKLTIRIGINSGPVTAGIVGSKMPQYCIFGDAVNVAARMQTTSFPTRIHVSEATNNLLVSHFYNEYILEKRGEIDVKGKGLMTTYWLLNENNRANQK